MLKPEFSGQFKKDYKLALKRGCDPKKLERVITLLCQEEQLPASYRDHALVNSRNYKEVYTSWIDDAISNYNSDFYYQSRDYLFACYQEGEICP